MKNFILVNIAIYFYKISKNSRINKIIFEINFQIKIIKI